MAFLGLYWGEENNPKSRTKTDPEPARTGHPFRRWLDGCPDAGQGQGWPESQWGNARVKTIRITDLIATNTGRYLKEKRVQKYLDGGGGKPYVMEADGRYYLVDGHHRVVAAYRRGETHIRARVKRVES